MEIPIPYALMSFAICSTSCLRDKTYHTPLSLSSTVVPFFHKLITSSQKDTVNESMVSHFNAEGKQEIEVSGSVDPCRAKHVSVLSVVNPPHTIHRTHGSRFAAH